MAVITGGANGIGRAVASLMSSEGSTVILADIDEDAAAAAVAELNEAGGQATFFGVDVSNETQVNSFAEAVRRAGYAVSVLVNNAGIAEWSAIADTTAELWNRVLNVNLRGAFFCSQAFLGELTATRGAIVNVASSSALVGMTGQSAYAASKGGMVAMTRAMAVELGPGGVRVNVVCPGAVKTGIMDKALAELPGTSHETLAQLSPLGRYGSPRDVAAVVAFLASEHARFITGACIVVDGGLTAR